MALDFDAAFGGVLETLGRGGAGVLATSSNDRVTARTVSYVVDDAKIYFKTDRNFEKYSQIMDNPRVAFCLGAVQIEGLARSLGLESDGRNAMVSGLIRTEHRSHMLDTYSHDREAIVIIEVSMVYVKMWGYRDSRPAIIFLDVPNGTALQDFYG
jgi:general stress protein 26